MCFFLWTNLGLCVRACLVVQRTCPPYFKVRDGQNPVGKRLSHHLPGQSETPATAWFGCVAWCTISLSPLFLIPPQVSHQRTEEISFKIHQKFKVGVLQPAVVSVYEYYEGES